VGLPGSVKSQNTDCLAGGELGRANHSNQPVTFYWMRLFMKIENGGDPSSGTSAPGVQPDRAAETRLEPPYRVIIHNDPVTPMDFVVGILRSVFLLDMLGAIQVMYTAHYHGSAVVQTLPRLEAQMRIGKAHMSARLNHFPLTFTLEPQEPTAC